MNPHWLLLDTWFVRSAVGGGVLLLLAWAAMCVLRQPARRQRLGGWTTLAAILVAVPSLLPAWLLVSYSVPAEAPPISESAVTKETAPLTADDTETLLAPAILAEEPLEDVPAEASPMSGSSRPIQAGGTPAN